MRQHIAGILGSPMKDRHLPFHEGEEFYGEEGWRRREPDEGAQEEKGEYILQFIQFHAGKGDDLFAVSRAETGKEPTDSVNDGCCHQTGSF